MQKASERGAAMAAMRSRREWLAGACLAGLLGLLGPAWAAEPPPASATLARIAASGQVVVGHRLNEVPFSYAADGHAVGYSVDLCRRIVEGIRRELGLAQLAVRYVPVTTATRFILVGNGSIDLECGATTNTAERRKLAEFSYPHFVTATRFVSLRKNGWQTLADLAGRSVVSTTGSINVEQLNTLSRAGNLNISVILSRDYKEAFGMVESGHAAAFVADDILLAGLVASASDPSAFGISRGALSRSEPYGILMPPGDLAFKAVVNRALRGVYDSGEIFELYRKWFDAPIPPAGKRLGLPLAPALEAVFQNPREYLD